MRDNRFNKYTIPSIATGLLLAIGGTACGSESLRTSPATESPVYKGDPNASGSNPLGWHEVIIADTQLQEPVTDAAIVVGFEEPGSDYWHDSKPMSLDPTESGEVLLRIGQISSPNLIKKRF
jgi:hypothetical protein